MAALRSLHDVMAEHASREAIDTSNGDDGVERALSGMSSTVDNLRWCWKMQENDTDGKTMQLGRIWGKSVHPLQRCWRCERLRGRRTSTAQ